MMTEAEFAALPVGTRVRVTWIGWTDAYDYVVAGHSDNALRLTIAEETRPLRYEHCASIEVLPPPPDPERERLVARVAELEGALGGLLAKLPRCVACDEAPSVAGDVPYAYCDQHRSTLPDLPYAAAVREALRVVKP